MEKFEWDSRVEYYATFLLLERKTLSEEKINQFVAYMEELYEKAPEPFIQNIETEGAVIVSFISKKKNYYKVIENQLIGKKAPLSLEEVKIKKISLGGVVVDSSECLLPVLYIFIDVPVKNRQWNIVKIFPILDKSYKNLVIKKLTEYEEFHLNSITATVISEINELERIDRIVEREDQVIENSPIGFLVFLLKKISKEDREGFFNLVNYVADLYGSVPPQKK